MLQEVIEGKWLACFSRVLALNGVDSLLSICQMPKIVIF